MNNSIGGRPWRCGALLAWLPLTVAASAAASAASGVEVVGETLVIEGTSESDRILISATRQPDTVRVIIDGRGFGPFGPVARVAVRAGDGDDTVLVSAAVELPVRIDAGPGDDRLRGGAGADLVFGGEGHDVLFTSLGRDALDGGPGSNRLVLGRPMGEIQVGSSAAGDALRILAKAYDLRPLADPSAAEPGPHLVGPAELQDDEVVERLRTSYQAGHAIALAGAEAADAERLRGVLGHASGAGWSADFPQADLVAFRRMLRPDGRSHESTSILLPRQAVEGSPAEARRGGRAADMLAVEGLSRLFSGTPVVPDLTSGDGGACANVPPDQCLQTLADSYQTHVVVQNTSGDQVQTVNSAWALRSFLNQEDLYYILQEVDYHVGSLGQLGLSGWFMSATNTLLGESPAPTAIQTSPQTTMSTRSSTSGVSESVGGAAGWNQMQGLNATLTGGVTISNSTTVTIPPISITNDTDLETGVAAWVYEVNNASDNVTQPETITFYNQWIWEVPFTTYDTGQDTIDFHSSTVQDIHLNLAGSRGLKADLDSTVPLPFGDTFALQQPAVTSVDPDDVCAGDEFTIAGTGLYPSLVEAVVIDGTALDSSAFSTVSDTEITVVAPDTLGIALPVAVRTGVALSNADVTIAIDPICAPAATSAPAPADAQAAAVGADS